MQQTHQVSIEGTYKLLSRRLSNGTIQKSPEIMGLFTYTKSYRNFNMIAKDATDKFMSFSLISTYKLTATEYTETLMALVVFNPWSGKEALYEISDKMEDLTGDR